MLEPVLEPFIGDIRVQAYTFPSLAGRLPRLELRCGVHPDWSSSLGEVVTLPELLAVVETHLEERHG